MSPVRYTSDGTAYEIDPQTAMPITKSMIMEAKRKLDKQILADMAIPAPSISPQFGGQIPAGKFDGVEELSKNMDATAKHKKCCCGGRIEVSSYSSPQNLKHVFQITCINCGLRSRNGRLDLRGLPFGITRDFFCKIWEEWDRMQEAVDPRAWTKRQVIVKQVASPAPSPEKTTDELVTDIIGIRSE